MRIAHISDLHFSKPTLSPGQLFSKAWLGNLNLLLNRGNHFCSSRPYALIEPFKKNDVNTVIISGDLTTTSSKKEYECANHFVQSLKKEGIEVYLIPGNHDHYTQSAYRRQAFYHTFSSIYSKDLSYNLADHGVTAKRLPCGWWLIGMDTTLATPLVSSNGYFSHETEQSFKKVLSQIPQDEKILLVNHFPFFQNDRPNRRLKRGSDLQKVIEDHPNIQLYLHGHTHRRCVADLRTNALPIILDSGSTAYTHGSWNLLDLDQNHCHLTVFGWEKQKWNPLETHEFNWKTPTS